MTKSIETRDGICYMCSNACPTKIHIRDGKAVRIDIADERAAHCPHGKARLDFIYHPDCLRYPIKRAGARVPVYTHPQYRNMPRLRKVMPEPLADIHADNASPRSIATGDTVTISTPRARIRMKVRVTGAILPGVSPCPINGPARPTSTRWWAMRPLTRFQALFRVNHSYVK